MVNLIKNRKIDEISVIQFIKKAYTVMNGWINPINKSKKLNIISYAESQMYENKSISGKADWESITICAGNMNGLEDGIKSTYGFNDEELNANLIGHFIMTIAHELSHLDQNALAYKKINDAGDFEFDTVSIEVSNSRRANLFVDEHLEELAYLLCCGIDTTLGLNSNPWNFVHEDEGEEEYQYHMITTKEDKLKEVVEIFGGVESKDVDVYHAKIIINGKSFSVSKTLKYADMLFGHKNWVSTVSGTAKSLIINLVENGTTEYPYNVVYN